MYLSSIFKHCFLLIGYRIGHDRESHCKAGRPNYFAEAYCHPFLDACWKIHSAAPEKGSRMEFLCDALTVNEKKRFADLNKPMTEFFETEILGDKENHRMCGKAGSL